ncbi:hypothetical protein N7481_006870 [Penicillium waksmanii]|uniref:uncharacterized protein n=1 Tax=Penicillium waksmanii TaxID=69791 RepID=UPI0025488AD1|nr:uncharacterized protein N7481_006870 [Penicillium waksmanii]KAJ5979572.1 hypothetical protein N7481_006870 [Penicillium waksmanii]
MSCRYVSKLSCEEKRAQYDLSNSQETWQGLRDEAVNIGSQFVNYELEATQIKERIHDLWDELIHAAIAIPTGGAEHDRLVTLVLSTREMGVLARRGGSTILHETSYGEEAILPNGQRLWIDLPYFIEDVQAFWTQESVFLAASKRENLATWTAKLCAAGVFANELSSVALWLFKETFEIFRRSDKSEAGGNAEQISMIELLPACTAWMQFNNFKLVKFAVANRESQSANEKSLGALTLPGELAKNAQIPTNGFSIPRWVFWRQRLKDLHEGGDAQMMKMTRACFEAMILTGIHIGVAVPGERRYLNNLFRALDEELASREVKTSIGPEDIAIDMKWAESDEENA